MEGDAVKPKKEKSASQRLTAEHPLCARRLSAAACAEEKEAKEPKEPKEPKEAKDPSEKASARLS